MMASFDGFENVRVGSVVFVARYFFENSGRQEWRVSAEPWSTNISREPRLRGWCGSTNNVGITAAGVAVVSAIFPRVGRLRLRVIPPGLGEERAALESMGWEDLA